jgi:DNA polymerase-3 subunit delta
MVESTVKPKKKSKLIYVICGKDESLVGAECRELIERLLKPSQRATGLFDADPAAVSAAEVFDELRTLPFLSERRVVLIRRADGFVSKNRELLERYFDSPCPTGVLILAVSSWPSNTKLARKLGKVGERIGIKEPKPWQLPERLTSYARDAHNKRLSKDTAGLLVELVGDEPGRLYSEVDKLALFVDKEKTITVRHVESLIGHNRIFGAFEVIDAIVAGRAGEAVARLRKMFAEDRSAEYTVVGAFAFHLRRMFGARVRLDKGQRKDEIAREMRIWGKKEEFFERLGGMSLERIGEYLLRLGETDYAIKRGQATAQVAMEQLVLTLASG